MNLTSLIDVVFILLVAFMIVAPALQHGLQVDLAEVEGEALKLSGIRRVSVVTPYTDAINKRLTAFLEGHGFEVLSMAGQQIVPNLEIGAQTPEVIAAFAKANLSPEADGLFLSCTNWRSMEVAEQLEQELGVPVVTSNQATIWATFRILGFRGPVSGYGKLLSSLSSPAKA